MKVKEIKTSLVLRAIFHFLSLAAFDDDEYVIQTKNMLCGKNKQKIPRFFSYQVLFILEFRAFVYRKETCINNRTR